SLSCASAGPAAASMPAATAAAINLFIDVLPVSFPALRPAFGRPSVERPTRRALNQSDIAPSNANMIEVRPNRRRADERLADRAPVALLHRRRARRHARHGAYGLHLPAGAASGDA